MILLIALTLFAPTVFAPTAQDTLSLNWFHEQARANHPLLQEQQLYTSIADVSVRNLDARYLPALSLGGQAVYQSEVPVLPFNVPGTTPPDVAEDQYRVGLNVRQLIYDGGVTAQQKKVEYARSDLSRQEVEVELYALKSRVNDAYFNVLLLQARIALLHSLETDIQSRLQQITSRIEAGLVLPSNADVLRAELIKLEQQLLEASARRRAMLDMLGEWVGRHIADDNVLELPEVAIANKETQHPNYDAFELRRSLLDRQAELVSHKNKISIFSTAEMAYGRPPGMNIFENDFKPFYALGLKVSWTFWDWHTRDRERQVLTLQQQMVDRRESVFSREITLAQQQVQHEIEQLDQQLQKDVEIIALRQKIVSEASTRLENGVITATDYLLERNAEHQAALNQKVHRIQLEQAKVNYMTIIGAEL